MRVLSKADVFANKSKLLKEIKEGAVFIYPTDTIYGIGCIASNDTSVKRIREIKSRDKKPFSVIAPSLDWIRKFCFLNDSAKKWLLKLPGPFTLVLPLKKHAVSIFCNSGLNSLGVRIPDHWISNLVQDIDAPLVTTSVNISGESASQTLQDMFRFTVDFVIYEGPLTGKSSTVVDLTKEEKVVRN